MMITKPELSRLITEAVVDEQSYDELNRKILDIAGGHSGLPVLRSKIKEAYNSLKDEFSEAQQAGPLLVQHFIWQHRQQNLAERLVNAISQTTAPDAEKLYEYLEAIQNVTNGKLNSNYRMRRDRFEELLSIVDDFDTELSQKFRAEYEELFPVSDE